MPRYVCVLCIFQGAALFKGPINQINVFQPTMRDEYATANIYRYML